MDVFQLTKMDKIHLSYILQLSMMTLALFIITTTQVKAQQGQDSHGLTPEQVKQFCRSDNPRLNFVNQTESEICGLPKSTPSIPTSNSSGSSSQPAPSSQTAPSSGSVTPQAS
jgi:hypothetical protein